MSYDHMERKPGLKRKATDNLRGEPKKLKREPDIASENPDKLEDEIDNLQRELELLDAEIKNQGGDLDVGMSDLQEPVEFSEDSEIQVDDDSRSGLSQLRSRRTPRPNRTLTEFEVIKEEKRRATIGPPANNPPVNHYASKSNHVVSPPAPVPPQPVQPVQPVRQAPPAQPTRKASSSAKSRPPRGRGANSVNAAVAAPASSSRSRGGSGRGRVKWKPVLPAPSWPIPRKISVVKKAGPDPMSMCSKILKDLARHKHAWPFMLPVDVKGLKLIDYYDIVTRPMDLGTVQAKLSNSQYSNVTEFAEDVRLTFRNAMKYNPPQNDFHVMAKTLLKVFEEKLPKALEIEGADPAMKKIQLEQSLNEFRAVEERLKQQYDAAQKELEKSKISEIADISPALKPKASVTVSPMEYEDKSKLSQNINTLGLRFMKGLFQIFQEEKPDYLKSESEIIDVETDRLSDVLLRRLESYVSDCRALEQQQKLAMSSSGGNQPKLGSAPSTPTPIPATQSKPAPSSIASHLANSVSSTSTPLPASPPPTPALSPPVSVPAPTPTPTPISTTQTNTSAQTANTSQTTNTSTQTTSQPSSTQGGKQPQARTENKDGKKEDSDDESSSSSDSSSSEDSSDDSDSEENNANGDKKSGQSKKNKGTAPTSITLTTTSNTSTSGTINGAQALSNSNSANSVITPHTTIPGIAVMTPKPFILPTQKEEKQVVLMNVDSWSGLVSGSSAPGLTTGLPSSQPKSVIPGVSIPTEPSKSTDVSEVAAQLSVLASIVSTSQPALPTQATLPVQTQSQIQPPQVQPQPHIQPQQTQTQPVPPTPQIQTQVQTPPQVQSPLQVQPQTLVHSPPTQSQPIALPHTHPSVSFSTPLLSVPSLSTPPLSVPHNPPLSVPSLSVPSLSVPAMSIKPTSPPSVASVTINNNNHTNLIAAVGNVVPSVSGSMEGGEFGGNHLWEDVKKRAAQNKQRERERAELEAAVQRQVEQEKLKTEREAQARRQAEEEKKKKEQEEELQKQIAKEREMDMLREAERAKREKVAPSVNLTSQSEIMANLERGVFGQGVGVDVTSLLGLKRRDDDED